MPNINDKYDIQKQKMLNRPRADSISKESEITTFVLLTLKTLWPIYNIFHECVRCHIKSSFVIFQQVQEKIVNKYEGHLHEHNPFMNTTHMQFSQRLCLMILSTRVGLGNRNSTKPPLGINVYNHGYQKNQIYLVIMYNNSPQFFWKKQLKYPSESFDGNYF